MRSNNKNQGHIALDQPLIHLFSVPLTEVVKRVGTGSKWADKRVPKSDHKKGGK